LPGRPCPVMETVSVMALFLPGKLDPWLYLPPLLEAHLPGLGGHCLRTSRKVAALSRLLAWPAEGELALSLAALYHDVGKLYLPARLLATRKPLTPKETALVRRHVPFALRLLASSTLPKESLEAIAHHHERWDGGGYPLGLAGPRIPWGARLLALADVYDTLTHPRSYGRVLTRREALGELRRSAGRQLDPGLVPFAYLLSED
jgi:putative nucleotidyltransferase with HDIG domain